eukprot:TRINITY_DN477_c0_g2_i1.p2 TRINITY_DN477_c0_g2~~TRINITY_DN477_c0_g2_i1.p2  ORF type:complete len:117 (-),score=9.98 TRINITY_DN477_c0_g2_i1:87-437(-)
MGYDIRHIIVSQSHSTDERLLLMAADYNLGLVYSWLNVKTLNVSTFSVLSGLSRLRYISFSNHRTSQRIVGIIDTTQDLSLIHISEPTRPLYISYAVFCLKKKKKKNSQKTITISK